MGTSWRMGMGASLIPRLWVRTVGPKTLEMDELVLALPKS